MLENPMYQSDPPEPISLFEHSVDLKWSLWSLDEGTWEERDPGTWAQMKLAFEGTFDVIIQTAPSKEIRFGTVKIREGAAEVDFTAEWDNGRVFCVSEIVLAETFEQLMHMIDHREIDLMRIDHEASHGKQGRTLQSLRCHDCGYPYKDLGSRRLA